MTIDKQTKEKIFLIMLVLALLVGGYNYFYVPLGKKLDDARKQLEQKIVQYSAMKLKAESAPLLKKNLSELRRASTKIEKVLPLENAFERIISDMTRRMSYYKIFLNTFVPQDIISREGYYDMPFRVTISGDYHKLGGFFASIARLERIITIKDFKFNYRESQDKDQSNIDADCMLMSYMYKG